MKFLHYILPILLVISCVDEVPFVAENTAPQGMVVHAFLNPDSAVRVSLARVSNVSEPYIWISDAQVSLKKKNASEYFLSYIVDGQYTGNQNLSFNDSVKVSISHPLYSGVVNLKIPSKVLIRQIDTFSSLVGTVGKTKSYKIHFKDSAYNRNFYRIYGVKTLKKYVLDLLGNKIDSINYTEKMSIGGSEIPFLRNVYNTYSTKEIMFSDETFNGVSAKFVVYETLNKPLPRGVVLLYTDFYLENMTEEMYHYLNSRNAHLWQQSSITQLPTKILGNLGNAYGVICGFASTKYRIVY